MHWANELVGTPWSADGDGPERYSCWNFVRLCVRIDQGVELPLIGVESDENVAALTKVCHDSGWRLVEGEPQAGDIVVMRNKAGERHVGYMVFANKGLRVIHCDGREVGGEPQGFVVAQTLKNATSTGYANYEFWRRV